MLIIIICYCQRKWFLIRIPHASRSDRLAAYDRTVKVYTSSTRAFTIYVRVSFIENVFLVFFLLLPRLRFVSRFSARRVLLISTHNARSSAYHPVKIVVFSVVYTTNNNYIALPPLHYDKKKQQQLRTIHTYTICMQNIYIYIFFIRKKPRAIRFDRLIAVVIDFATYLTQQLLRNVSVFQCCCIRKESNCSRPSGVSRLNVLKTTKRAQTVFGDYCLYAFSRNVKF